MLDKIKTKLLSRWTLIGVTLVILVLGFMYWREIYRPDTSLPPGFGSTASPATVAPSPVLQPTPADYVLTPYQGDVFAIKKPGSWKVTDNLNAIETSDPDDPLTGVSGSIILGAFGEQTPDGHLRQVLDSIGATEVRYEHRSAEERVKERWTGLTWVIRTQTFTFRDANGNRVKAKASAGVLQGSGQYVAMISSFQTTPDKWGRWAPALERIMQTILITDGKRAGGYDKVRLPTAADVRSDSSPLMESWEYRNRSGDHNSQGFSDATLGQESGLVSSSSGTSYTLPLADYDPTVGGYRNPDQPSEILVDQY
ncbi:MAG: hypothetical protein Q8Q11_00080 [bacterium]|nr:hypothetical protein [bacterium]